MPTVVRSYSKINLGLAIGRPREDGYHSLLTLYQTVGLYDVLTVSARRRNAGGTRISLSSNDPRVPVDGRNTVWKMVEKMLARVGVAAQVKVHIQKNLPIQGGMGAGSANAAAALLGLERELRLKLSEALKLEVAAEVGSDVPLFLIGGTILGTDRGQVVKGMEDLTAGGEREIACVIALPGIGVSTPLAFRSWDRQYEAEPAGETGGDLHNAPVRDTLEELSRTYASVFSQERHDSHQSGASGIFPDPKPAQLEQDTPENMQGLSREQHHTGLGFAKSLSESGSRDDLAENSLLSLVRTGIENDFESVVFPQYPSLREIKRLLMGSPLAGSPAQEGHDSSALYAALSGSGSALFGLYGSQADAGEAQQRLQQHGVKAIVTKTIPRPLYWSSMFAE